MVVRRGDRRHVLVRAWQPFVRTHRRLGSETDNRAPRWWLAAGYGCGLFAWYAVQVHQTKFVVEIGFSATDVAWALGVVSLAGIPGQIALGYLSDRIGREWV